MKIFSKNITAFILNKFSEKRKFWKICLLIKKGGYFGL